MIRLYAPDFKKKLDLLARHAGFKNIAAIADEMDVKESTLRSWTVPHTGRKEGTISKKGREPVIRLFCAHLPHLSEAAVIDLLEGPINDMEIAFFTTFKRGLAEFIDRKASFDGMRLVVDLEETSPAAVKCRALREEREKLKRISGKLMVTLKLATVIEPDEFVPLGADFRIEFPMARRAKHFVGLQQNSQGWAVVPAAPLKDGKAIYMPQPLQNGELDVMAENHDHGGNRFTLIQSMTAFPEFIYANLMDCIPLSRTEIGFLTRYLSELPKADLTIHAIDIEFVGHLDTATGGD